MRKIISLILAVIMLCSIFALPAAAETDNRVWFDIKGNSRFFVKTGDGIYENRLSYIEYLPGVDFAGFVETPTGVFETDQAAVKNPINGGAMFLYKIGEPSDTHNRWSTTVLTEATENSAYWTINGVPYLLNLNENVIKVCNNAIDTSALTNDAEKKARYESINKEAVIDVTDGRYKSIGLLAGIASGKTRNAIVTLVYSDEEVEKPITIQTPTITDEHKYSNGNIYLKNFTHTNDNDNGAHGFIPLTIETEPSKPLTAIKIKDATTSSSALSIYVISAWGTKGTLAEVIAEIDGAIEKATTAEELEAIDIDSIEKEFSCDLSEQETLIANKIAKLKKAEQIAKKPTYYYPIEYNRDAFATYAEILEYGAFDSTLVFPVKDLKGNQLNTETPWIGYKGLGSDAPNSVVKGRKMFLIDSIEGAEEQLSAERYKSATDYTILTTTKTLQVNGVENYKLQSTETNGAKNYIYDAGEFKYKFGPIGGTGDRLTPTGGYNVRLLSEREKYTFTRTQEDANKFGALFALADVTGEKAYAALEKVVITYNDGREPETKYLVMTAMNSDADIYEKADSDGDRLGRVVVAVPKKDSAGVELDHTSGAVLKANAKILSEKTSEEIAGKKLTIKDVTFPSDFIVGESMPIADFAIGRNYAAYNNRRYCPQGYANHYEFDFGEDVASIEYQGDYTYAKSYQNAVLNNNEAYIPVKIPVASEDYIYYARFGRPCGHRVSLLAASSMGASLGDKINAIETRIEKLPEAYLEKDAEEILAIREAINELKAGGVVTEEDFDEKLYEKIEYLYEQKELMDSYGESIKELVKILNNMPEKYSKETGKEAAQVKRLIDELIKEGVKEEYIKGLSPYYERYESHLATYNEWLNVKNSQDRMVIDWTEKDDQHAADIFEFSTAKLEEIPNKQGIVMNSVNDVYPTTYKHGSFIGFYSTDSAKTKNPDTFPDKYNQYYIKNNNITYGYKGISETIGENTYNAGMIAPSYGFEIPFDAVTKYDTISILANGITYLSGEWGRQLQAIKTKVYFADGTSKEKISFVGNFGYSYRMALYSMLDSDSLPYSEFLSTRIKTNLDELWYPKEANVSSYFKLAPDSIRLYYKADQVTKGIATASTLGRATTINIDAEGKAVEKVSVSYATASDLHKMGGVAYDKYIRQETKNGVTTDIENPIKNTYYIPIDKSQLEGITGYEENRDYYMSVIINPLYPVYLHGVTGVRTNESSYAEDIAEIENIIKGLSEEFNINEVKDMKDAESRIAFLENQGVSEASFDSALLEKLENLLESNVAENGHYEIYVSPDGDDSGYGYKDFPVQTLERAKVIARTYKNARPVDIILLEGEHNLSKTFELTAFDSGTKENPVTIKGMGGVITTADTLSYYDFEKVTEKEAGERLQPEVIGKVLKVNLSDHGIYAGDMPMFYSTAIGGDGFEDVTFFVNDKEQSVAQYPNGESNYETWVDLADTSINAGKIKVNEVRAKKWQNEKFAYFEGYPAPDYSNERNNITIEGDLICFKNKARFELDENHSRRYKVKHMLYELDSPGEWYIDRDTNILYYYPTADFNEGSRIQIAARKLNAFTTTTGLSNFNFDGVKFDKIRGNAITAGYAHENVNVYNCQFTNISNIAVRYTASTNSPTLANIANYTDAAKNCEIRNNRFINIGCNAIKFIGGNRSTLSDGNNVIANNYIYNASDKQKCNPDIEVTGAKNYVLNNEIHMGTFHAINYSGNENVIAYNELYNMLRDTGDCGVIYNGRHLATRGTEIAYNYIHDYKHLDERTKDNGVAVYLDDRLSGISIHHNIIFANGVGENANGIQNGGGQHNKINYNTIVDADESMTYINRLIADYLDNSECTAFDELIRISGMASGGEKVSLLVDLGNTKEYTMLGKNEFYFERYPEMYDSIETLINPNETVPQFVNKYPFIKNLPEFSEGGKYGNLSQDIANGNDLTKYRILSLKSTIGNEYIGNISNTKWREPEDKDNDGNVYDVFKNFGSTITDNVVNATEDMFVNYAGKDFRIKGNTGGGALDESFDLNKIGIQSDGSVSYNLDFELNDINTVNPKEGIDRSFEIICVDGSDKSNVYLEWERVAPADYYTVEIATDENMSNIIYRNEDVYFTRLNVDLSEYNQNEFFVEVTARNIGRNGSQWTNSDGVRTIKTLYAVSVDIYEDATIPFDISTDFNADVFNEEGEEANKVAIGGDNNLGMYNLTNFKRIIPENGYFKYTGTVYHFPQVGYSTEQNNVIKTVKGKSYTYNLKSGEIGRYDKIKLATSAENAVKDYRIIAHYEDGSSEEFKVALHQYYTTYHSYETADTIKVVGGVNSKGELTSNLSRYTYNKIYQTVIDTDENRILESLEFVGGSGTVYENKANTEMIFAITGVQSDRILENGNKMQAFFMKNSSGEEKEAKVIITGYIDGKFETVIVPVTLRGNKYSGVLNVEIPEKAEAMTNRAMFIWDSDPVLMKAYTTKLPIK